MREKSSSTLLRLLHADAWTAPRNGACHILPAQPRFGPPKPRTPSDHLVLPLIRFRIAARACTLLSAVVRAVQVHRRAQSAAGLPPTPSRVHCAASLQLLHDLATVHASRGTAVVADCISSCALSSFGAPPASPACCGTRPPACTRLHLPRHRCGYHCPVRALRLIARMRQPSAHASRLRSGPLPLQLFSCRRRDRTLLDDCGSRRFSAPSFSPSLRASRALCASCATVLPDRTCCAEPAGPAAVGVWRRLQRPPRCCQPPRVQNSDTCARSNAIGLLCGCQHIPRKALR